GAARAGAPGHDRNFSGFAQAGPLWARTLAKPRGGLKPCVHPIGPEAHLSRMSQIRFILSAALAACALAACASAPASARASSPTVGRLYHYVRSNQDGSLPEQVYVY